MFKNSMAENTYHLINKMFSNFGDQTNSDEPIINMEELDKLNREYFNEDSNTESSDDNNAKSLDDSNAKLSSVSNAKLSSVSNAKLSSASNTKSSEISKEKSTNNSFTNIMSYIRIPSFLMNKNNTLSQTSSQNDQTEKLTIDAIDAFSAINEIKQYISDPLGFIIILLGSIFMYIYFAGELMCQALGLFYPCYYLYTLLHFKSNKKASKIKSIMKYIILYGHLEMTTSIFGLVGFHFYHLKILIIISLLYMAGYRQEWLDKSYDNVVFYDKIILGLLHSSANKFSDEYSNIKHDLVANKRSKEKLISKVPEY